jgi:hypothetical protein
MRLEFRTPVRCADDLVGETADVVVDPATRRLTHVVVKARDNVVRLVPAELVAPGRDGKREIALTCTPAELDGFEPIRELAYLRFDELPTGDEDTDVGVEDIVSMAYYEPVELGDYVGADDPGVSVTYDRIPKGEAELRSSSDVVSSDGHSLGSLAAVVVDGVQVTHVVLERGHYWRTRDVTIPIDSVESIATDCVGVTLTKDEVEALPSVRARWRRFLD